MTTNVLVVRGSEIVHVGSGNSLTPGAFGPSSFSTALSGTGNLSNYPRCDVTLFVVPTSSIASQSATVALYRRDINIDGTNDETVPDASNRNKFMGAFNLKFGTTVTTTHYVQMTDVPLPGRGDCEFYISNDLNCNIPAGWTLKITPKTDAV